MKYLMRFLIAAFLSLPFVSLFLWAGFDWTWWTPTNGDKDRMFGIFLLHMLSFMVSIAGGAFLAVHIFSEDA